MTLRTRAVLLPILGVLAIACAQEEPRVRAEAPSTNSAASQSDSTPGDTAAADTAGCDAIPKQQFSTPEELVAEWVRRDSLGLFMAPDDRLFELMACPGHSGGGDEIVVAVEPTIIRQPDRVDSAAFLIIYRRYGAVYASASDSGTFESRPGLDTIPVSAIHTTYGWRFPFDIANPHLPPRRVLTLWGERWESASRDSIEALAHLPRRHPL